MTKKSSLKKGIYKHYKGNEYEVVGISKHSETDEKLVVYKSLLDQKIWTRTLEMFRETVEKDGKSFPRFEYLREIPRDDFEDKYKRALAESQNILKRADKDKIEFAKYANGAIIEDIIPIYDNLRTSISNLDKDQKNNPWVVGVEYVIKQLQDLLKRYGIEEVKTSGKFDPQTMEASEGEGDKITKVLRPGYTLHGKLIQAARVILKN